jgi:hypothetical protein
MLIETRKLTHKPDTIALFTKRSATNREGGDTLLRFVSFFTDLKHCECVSESLHGIFIATARACHKID